MSNFVWDETALPADKADAINVPTGANTVNYIRGSDITAIFNALREIRLAAYKGGGVATPVATAPTDGTHEPGDLAFNSAPSEAGFLGWVCLTAGTPGQWRKFGFIAGADGDLQPGVTAHLADGSAAHAASAISNTPSGNLAATDQQGVNNELQTDIDTRATVTQLNDHLNDATDAHDASAISITAIATVSATQVQSALEEAFSDIAAISGGFPERKGSGTTAPVSGTYAKGDLWLNSDPDNTENIGWVCVVAGTPGTWKEFGIIADDVKNGDVARTAASISFSPAGSVSSITVQAAIEEVAAEAGGGGSGTGFTTTGSVAPASGTWAVGNTCLNTSPADGEPLGWICITAGTPGTWRAFGPILDHSNATVLLFGEKTWDPSSVASGAATGTTVTVTGASPGDQVIGVSLTTATSTGVMLTGNVHTSNTVDVNFLNLNGSTLNLTSGTLRVTVLKRV